ncbi:MAG TPA: hypothetical protein VGF35_09610 [Steroidobacteraceae bacterium]
MQSRMAGIACSGALALLLLGCSVALADEAAVQATWTAREFRYTYQGFTAKYSCDGLSDRIRAVLLLLGARKADLTVAPTGCSGGFGQATLFPGVAVKMSVLTPVEEKGADTEPVAAVWRNVDVPRRQPLAAAGDCELTEQIKAKILPLFATRNVEYTSTCVPHQLTPGGTTLKADVLVPAPPAPPAAAPGG